MQKFVTNARFLTGWHEGGRETISDGVKVYIAGDADARIADLERLLGDIYEAVTTNLPGWTLADIQDKTRPFKRAAPESTAE